MAWSLRLRARIWLCALAIAPTWTPEAVYLWLVRMAANATWRAEGKE
jgi:hypothetical protein